MTVYADCVAQLTTTQGTGSYTLGGAVGDLLLITDALSLNDEAWFRARDPVNGGWEVFKGRLINSTTLSRDEVEITSNRNTQKINWPSAAAKEIRLVATAAQTAFLDRVQSWSESQNLGDKTLRFGANNGVQIGGTDTNLFTQAGANATWHVSADGSARLSEVISNLSEVRALVLETRNSAALADGNRLRDLVWRAIDDESTSPRDAARIRVVAKNGTEGGWSFRLEIAVARAGTLTDAIVIDGSTSSVLIKSEFNLVEET